MKIGDLVQYVKDAPTSFAEYQNDISCNDIGLIVDVLNNDTTVRVKWFKNDGVFWIGKKHLEVISERQKTESN